MESQQHPGSAKGTPFTGYQKQVIALLAFLQFTIILDFMVISPLGAVIMPELKISPSQFGLIVSAYAFSAGISGFLSAGFADRFDRKKFLLFFYTGFVLATLLCGIAPTFILLLIARILTGVFGGVIGSMVLAITTDLFEYQVRGRVMGIIQTAFAASQILGLPAGMYFSNLWGWHAPFLMIVVVSALVGVVIWKVVKPIDAHLKFKIDRSPLHHIVTTVSTPRYILGFLATALLTTGGFMLMPFSSAFTVHNLGIPIEQLPMIYLVTGLSAIVVGPAVGRLSDQIGKFKTFTIGTVITTVMVVVYTQLGVSSLATVIAVNVVMFSGIFSRMIPAQALTSAIPTPDSRGAFMAVSSSLQQLSGGVAAMLAGFIVQEGSSGEILHFDQVGYVVLLSAVLTLILMYFVDRMLVTA